MRISNRLIFFQFSLFLETIDISKGTVTKNGYIFYEGVYYPPKYYRQYNYIIENDKKIKSDIHVRGCVCRLKQCISTCCPPGKVRKIDSSGCFKYPDQEFEVNFTLPDGTIASEQLNKTHYGFIQKLPCKKIVRLESELFDDEEWEFFQVTVSVSNCNFLSTLIICK
jgi:hypothetical protein